MSDDWSERPNFIDAAVQWRQERARAERARLNGQQARPGERVEPFQTIPAATLAGKARPREFLDSAQLIPLRTVAMLSGDGGVGKSLLAMQLAIAVATGAQWLGFDVKPGAVLYFSAEDDEDEITRRLNEICDAEGVALDQAFTLEVLPMLGQETALAVEKDAQLRPTLAYQRLDATIDALRPILVILDTLALVYAANENNRLLAQQFLSMLARLCQRHDCNILLLAHPSLAGIASGSGLSGTTGWNNGVRSRLYLHRVEDGEDSERVLEAKKANYAPIGQRFELQWMKGRFRRYEPASVLSRVAVDDVDKVRDQFRRGGWRRSEQSPQWGGYAVADILAWDVGRDLRASERSPEQEKNRKAVRQLLGRWLYEKAIFVRQAWVQGNLVDFYSDREEEGDGDEG